jgi:hypothetical protein
VVVNQHARMFKVMALLVVAMTITAAVLVWIEPNSTSAQDIAPLLAAQQAERVVAFDAAVPPGRWSQVEVVTYPDSPAGRSSMLTAVSRPDRFHFVVGETGFIRATTFWLEQEGIGEPPDVVRVGVACETNGPVSFVQRLALEALLAELDRQCSPPGGRLTFVSVHDPGGLDELGRLLAQTSPMP